MPAKGHAPPPEDKGGDSSRAGCQQPAPFSTLSAARDTLTNLTVPKSGRFYVQDAVSSRRLVESIEEKYYKFTAAVVIKYKYNTSMLITVWCKDNQILLPIKNAILFIHFYSTASDGTFLQLISTNMLMWKAKTYSACHRPTAWPLQPQRGENSQSRLVSRQP